MQNKYRMPTENEKKIIERLLSATFQGREQLVDQLRTLKVRTAESDDDYGTLELVTESKERANVIERVPVEAKFMDADGVPVFVLLHVVDGSMDELEIYKADGGAIINRINPTDLMVEVRD